MGFLCFVVGFFPPLCVADLFLPPPGVFNRGSEAGVNLGTGKIRSCLKQQALGDSKTVDFCCTLALPALRKVGLVASSPLKERLGGLGVGPGGPGEVRLALQGSPPLSHPLSPSSIPFSSLPFAFFWGRQHGFSAMKTKFSVPLSFHPAVGLPPPELQLPALPSLQSISFHPLLQRKGNLIYFKGKSLQRIHLQNVCEPMALMHFLASH